MREPIEPRRLLDRVHVTRRDARWTRERIADPRAFVVVVAGDKILASPGEPPQPLLVRREEIETSPPAPLELLLLGLRGSTPYLAVDAGDGTGWDALVGQRWVDLRSLGPVWDTFEGGLACLARSLVAWHRSCRFCGTCGHETVTSLGGFARVCSEPSCGRQHFPRTDPAVIVLVSNGDDVLLARQAHWLPGRYSALAGFVEPAESLEQAVIREVLEETGLAIHDVRYRFSTPWPFPSTLMAAFSARADERAIVQDEGELEDARWFSREEVRRGLQEGTMSLPPPFAAGFCLIQEWFDAQTPSLLDLVRG